MSAVFDAGQTVDQMSTTIDALTLDELATQAVTERQSFERHLAGALAHFVRLGLVLNEARSRVEAGWTEWLETKVGLNPTQASHAMRLAHYREMLPTEAWGPWVDAKGTLRDATPASALAYIRGLPPIRRSGHPGYSDDLKGEARRLRKLGMSLKDVGSSLDVSPAAVRLWCDPAAAKQQAKSNRQRQAELSAANRALRLQRQRDENNRIARASSGELSKSYSLIRQALATLDKVATERAADAIRHLHRAEEAVVAAMREAA